MTTLKDGTTSFSIKDLSKGLRKTKENQKNKSLIYCDGLIGKNGVLKTTDNLSRIDTSVVEDNFPFPQLFVLDRFILVCGSSKIYEYENNTLTLKITVFPGSTWSLVNFGEFIYISNGRTVVVRDVESREYSETTDYPTAMTICNYNGQILIGAPDAGYIGG